MQFTHIFQSEHQWSHYEQIYLDTFFCEKFHKSFKMHFKYLLWIFYSTFHDLSLWNNRWHFEKHVFLNKKETFQWEKKVTHYICVDTGEKLVRCMPSIQAEIKIWTAKIHKTKQTIACGYWRILLKCHFIQEKISNTVTGFHLDKMKKKR